MLVAAWSNVFDLCTRVLGWDLVVHFMALGGLGALLAGILLARAPLLRDDAK